MSRKPPVSRGFLGPRIAPLPVIQETAARVRSCYIQARRRFETAISGVESTFGQHPAHLIRWDGGTDPRGVRHPNIWLRIAEFVLAHKIEPEILVEAVFHFWSSGDPPKPNQLLGDSALQAVENYGKDQPVDVRLSLQNEKMNAVRRAMEIRAVRPGANSEEVWRSVLQSEVDDFSPLFRYCLARQTGCDDVAARFRDEALLQYQKYRQIYDEILGANIPEDLKAAVSC